MTDKKITAIETISTLQGEGPDSGKRMLLVRFKYCSKKCPYCDTSVKMRVTKEAEYSLQYLQEIIDNEKLGLLCTGGEPTFKPHIEDAASLLNELRYPISNVETNGYNLLELVERIDTTKNVKYIYSPKIFSSKDLDNEKNLTNEVKNLKNVFIKLVYENNEYIHDYLEFLSSLNINERIYIMPEGTTRESLIKNSPTVFDIIEKYMFNFSSRSHIIYEFV